jgi:hypothetical protein
MHADMLALFLAGAGLPGDPVRERLRVRPHSGVERLRFPDGKSVVLKYADAPFDHEHRVLRLVERHGVPVPHVRAARTVARGLAMLLEDLGEPIREVGDDDGARAAVRLHTVGETADARWLPRVDAGVLASMPDRIAAGMNRRGETEATGIARALAAAAPDRADGAELAPFGLCHSEFHPMSLHVGTKGWHLLDFARAFTGPGLLDLASWHDNLDDPDPARAASLIERYVHLGGHRHTLAARGGLDSAAWALGWHRVRAADWFTEQLEIGWAHGDEETWAAAITRHLTEAAGLLRV